MTTITVAGLNGDKIPSHLHEFFEDESCLIACSASHARIMENQFPGFSHERWIPIVPLQDCFEKVGGAAEERGILFLLSGDPLFFGLGKRLKQQFSDRDIRFLPAVSYMQSCFAHVGINWDDADFTSLHGRPLETIEQKLGSRKLFVYTDAENSPDTIAAYLLARFGNHKSRYVVHVGERIGSDRQRFITCSLDEAAAMSFAQPNSMILIDMQGGSAGHPARFGLSEDDIEHSRGMITKSEVRAAAIHRLQLPDNGVLWDIGAGSGSVGIEAARICPLLAVYAVERDDEQLSNIRKNKSTYGCRNLHIVGGHAPEVLADLPEPERVFIGGSGGRLEEIITYLADRIKGPVRIVATAVLKKTAEQAPELLYSLGFEVNVSIVGTSRYQYPAKDMTTFNPIHIICGIRT